MLIVNQKRDIVINFSNVLSIYVQENNVQTLISCIEDALILGKYKTEERAKEVLQEIINAYSDFNYYKSTVDKEKQKKIGLKIYERYRNLEIYKMPEE